MRKFIRTLVAVVVLNIMLALCASHIVDPAGGGVLDLRFAGFTVNEAMAYLSAIGTEGRSWYKVAWVVDLFYPAAIFTLNLLLIKMLWYDAVKKEWARTLLVSAPAWALAFDYMENISIGFALFGWPMSHSLPIMVAGEVFTPAKWFCAAITIATIIVGLVFAMVVWVRKAWRIDCSGWY